MIEIGILWKTSFLALIEKSVFTLNPVVSDRLFATIAISKANLDSDTLRQMIVFMVQVLKVYSEQKSLIILDIVRCITTIFENDPKGYSYLPELYWMCLSLLKFGEPAIFRVSAKLMLLVLGCLVDSSCPVSKTSEFNAFKVSFIDDAITKYNKHLQIDLDLDSSLFLAAVCLKGMSDPTTKTITHELLLSVLKSEKNHLFQSEGTEMQGPVSILLLLAPSENLEKLLQFCGIQTARRTRSSVYGGSADQKTIFLIDKLLIMFEAQPKDIKLVQLCMIRQLLDFCNSESELLLLCRILSRMSERKPESLAAM
jgi:hypothetical protein